MTSWWLLDNPNPYASEGFWGYPSRRSPVRLVVIHTTENLFDTVGPDDGAEAVARYLDSVDRPASYHDIVDSDSHVPMLPWTSTAFGARGHNSHALHFAFAGRAADWDNIDDVDVRLARMAPLVRTACDTFDIPVRRLRGAEARTVDAAGICGHTDLDPDRRTDPGVTFPWARLLDAVTEETDMPLTDDDIERVADAVFARIWGTPLGRQDYTHAQALGRIYRAVMDRPRADADAIVDELADRINRGE